MGPAASDFGGPGKAMLCVPTAPRSARAGLSVMGGGGGGGRLVERERVMSRQRCQEQFWGVREWDKRNFSSLFERHPESQTLSRSHKCFSYSFLPFQS